MLATGNEHTEATLTGGAAGRLDHVRYQMRRVGQTRARFVNWPSLLAEMALEPARRGTHTLTFRTRDGITMTCPNVPGARLAIYEQFADDAYRLDWFLGELRTEPLTVIDVGAHIGSFSINVARANPQTRVFSYEPSPGTAEYLRRNVADNGLSGRVTVNQAAVSDQVGEAMLDDNAEASVHNGLVQDGARLVADEDGAGGTRRVIAVPTTTFDLAVAAAGGVVDLVKLDCEGAEYALVSASSPSSWQGVRRLVLEYHHVEGQSWEALRDWFAGVGLRVVRHDSNGPGLGTAWLSRDSV
jgi:FkbM family methyltransferase